MEPDANNIAMTTMKTRMKHTPFAVPLYDLGRPLAHVFFTPTACKSGKLRWALKPERPHETHWKPRRPFATMDRAVQAGVGIRRRQRAQATSEIKWNGAMIGDLRRLSLDA